RWQPKVQQLIEKLTDKLSNHTTTVKTSRVTQPKEFNLTVPKPRAIPPPSPAPLPVLPKRQPVPSSIYKPPKERKKLEEIKTKNIQKSKVSIRSLTCVCKGDPFSLNTLPVQGTILTGKEIDPFPPQYLEVVWESVLTQYFEELTIDNIPIKLNTAAILREGALYQRKLEEELRRIENLQQGAGDPSEFLEWQKQMRGKDLEEHLAEIECRRLQGKLSYEEAVLAHQNVIQENKKKADLLREEKADLMHLYAEKCLQEQKEMKELVEQVMEGHKNVKQVKAKIQEYKQQIVQQVCEESGELLRQALEEKEDKNRKRYELIQQIRAIESTPSIRHKFVDLTEVSSKG
ncbi:CFA99 protein, partial [Tichodroma muraria]|nr:CFA99 protein [Tichodroma muraria]